MNNLNAKDVNGMTVGQYGQRFTNAMAPQLSATNVGSAPPIGAALPPPSAAAPQLPASPQQQQQLPGGAVAAGAGNANPLSPPQQLAPMLQQLQSYRPQINMASLQNFMSQLPATLKPLSF
jgi:hypothetical protein